MEAGRSPAAAQLALLQAQHDALGGRAPPPLGPGAEEDEGDGDGNPAEDEVDEAAFEEALALEAASEPATSEAGGGVDDLAVAGLAGEPELELFAADAAVETAEIEALAAAPEAPAGGDGGIEVAGTGPLAEPDTDDPGGFPYLPLQIAAGAVLGALLLGLLYLRRRRI